jgi:hypothetical protein
MRMFRMHITGTSIESGIGAQAYRTRAGFAHYQSYSCMSPPDMGYRLE